MTRAPRRGVLAAYLNGLLVLLGLGATGWLLFEGVGWGAYGNSFGFATLMLATILPLGLALAAASTIPQLLQVIPAGAKVGQVLYGVFVMVGTGMCFKGDGMTAKVVGGAVVLVALGAVKLLGKAELGMRGDPRSAPQPAPRSAPQSVPPSAPAAPAAAGPSPSGFPPAPGYGPPGQPVAYGPTASHPGYGPVAPWPPQAQARPQAPTRSASSIPRAAPLPTHREPERP
ncbi:hypothetical protein AB0A69_27305 [Streptomyces sp. NPDC045431]|uniref:hypothetical protein n=1 Tax=Streptomyces sp. NPDC045431 TaxID=3155613 RepID=UPI0034054160